MYFRRGLNVEKNVWGGIIVIVVVTSVAGALFFNNTDQPKTELNNPIIGTDNQTIGNNSITSDFYSFSNYFSVFLPYSGFDGQSSANPTSPADPMVNIISRFDDYIKSIYNQSLVTSAAVVVVQNGKIIYMNTLGVKDIASGEPVDENTLFNIGSITKAITATNIAQLVSQGLMSWDDPVAKYYPDKSEFQLYSDYVTYNITIRDCLSDRSGLPDNGNMIFNDSYALNLYKTRFIANSTQFRSIFQYNNIIYALAGHCAARAMGTTWDELVKKELLIPLGVTTATTTYTDLINSPNHAKPYILVNGNLIEYDCQNEAVGPEGIIGCSISEIANWLKFQIADTGMYNGVQIVSKKDLDETRTAQIEVPASDPMSTLYGPEYGFGWFINKDNLVHCGATVAYHSFNKIYTSKGMGIAILTDGPFYAMLFIRLYLVNLMIY
jgi:CubicO group peptidase (beta-lactamase class C family)